MEGLDHDFVSEIIYLVEPVMQRACLSTYSLFDVVRE